MSHNLLSQNKEKKNPSKIFRPRKQNDHDQLPATARVWSFPEEKYIQVGHG